MRNTSNLDIVIDILIIIRLVLAIMPIAVLLPQIIRVGSLVLLVLLLAVYTQKISRALLLAMGVYAVEWLAFLFGLFKGKVDFVNEMYELLSLTIWPIVACHLLEQDNIVRVKRILFAATGAYFITFLTSWYGNIAFGGALEVMFSGSEYQNDGIKEMAIRTNFGTFHTIYVATLFVPICIYAMKERLVKKHIALLGLLIIFGFIMSANLTTAILMSLFLLCTYFLSRGANVKTVFKYIIICAVIGFFLTSIISLFLQNIANNMENARVAQRLGELSYFLQGNLNSSDRNTDFGSRLFVWESSWRAFLSNPITGNINDIGHHSQILDTLGGYGLFGLIAMLISWKGIYRFSIVNYISSPLSKYAFVIYVANIFEGLLNPVNSILLLVLYIPLLYKWEENITLQNAK